MATTTTILVLTLGCVWGWENIPAIPSGRRAEYYLLHDDGAYKFGYDTGAGQSAIVNADPGNQVQGKYEYVDKGGKKVALTYTAGDGGFVPQTVAGASAGSVVSLPASNYQYSAQDGVAVDANYDANADASYAFNIDTDSYKRTETSDSKGNIRGQYAYSSPVGGSHAISYAAGEGTGFVVTGGDTNAVSNIAYISPGPAPYAGVQVPSPYAGVQVPSPYAGVQVSSLYAGAQASNARSNVNMDGSYAFSYNTADQSREESADAKNNVRGSYSFKAKDDGLTRRVDYAAGADSGFVVQGAHLPEAPSVLATPNLALAPIAPVSVLSYSSAAQSSSAGLQPDGSYAFSYGTGEQVRQESADSQNNVRGSFSFKAKDDGLTRRVDYEAGAATGFVAKGAHIPVVAPSVGVAAPLGGVAVPVGGYAAPLGGVGVPLVGYAAPSVGSVSQGDVVSTYAADEAPSGDASYSFSYNTGDSARQESSDAQGNVKGEYAFVAKDGVQRKVDYTAGAGIGFVAKAAHLPVVSDGSLSSVAGGYSAGVGTGGYSAGVGTGGYSAGVGIGGYSVGIGGYSSGTGLYSSPAVGYAGSSQYSARSSGVQPDGSYSFSYQADDHSREESADANNNVRGSFTFKAKDDGQARRLDYQAGAATGFIAKGAHLPEESSLASGYSASALSNSGNAVQVKSSGGSEDGSYSFSYNAGDHSREESGDAKGNVRGRFSFVAKDDGQARHVEYEAGAEKGFIAQGAHVPVPGAPVAVPGYQAYSGVQTSGISSYSSGSDDLSSGDASYSYGYKTDSSSKQEASDAQGNVVGSFTFVGGDGVSRSVQYTSRGKEGFVVNGAHLPTSGGDVLGNKLGNAVSGYSRTITHAKSGDVIGSGVHVHKYLPPESPHKFGYVFDTSA